MAMWKNVAKDLLGLANNGNKGYKPYSDFHIIFFKIINRNKENIL
jgi:hypothetical protein